MSEAEYAEFDKSEYQERYRQLRLEMEEEGLDAILVTNELNNRYFAGFLGKVFALDHYYFFTLLPRDESLEPTFLCANGFSVAATSWIDDRRCWDWPENFYASKESPGVAAVANLIREKGLSQATIGVELANDMHPHIGISHVQELYQSVPDVSFVDGSDAIMKVRAIKSAGEVERLRRAARISAKGVRFGFESLHSGMTEMRLTQIMSAHMLEMGATDIRPRQLCRAPANVGGRHAVVLRDPERRPGPVRRGMHRRRLLVRLQAHVQPGAAERERPGLLRHCPGGNRSLDGAARRGHPTE